MLLGNYNVFNRNPGREYGGVTNPVRWLQGGAYRNFWTADAAVSGETIKAAWPVGYNTHWAYSLSPTAGGLSTHNATNVSKSATALLVGGLPGSASANLTFTTTATGGLIVSGSGTAAIEFTPTGTIISVASGSGAASLLLSATAAIGAEASLSGTGTITIGGEAISYAVGFMSGTSSNETEFSADVLARAVWDALAADFSLPGTMGEKLSAAGSAGDPWSTALPGSYAAGTAGDKLSKALSVAKFIGLK